MAPSVYMGCQIEDDIDESLKQMRGVLQSYQKQTDDALVTLSTNLAQLEGPALYSTATIGAGPVDQVSWTAVQPGSSGDQIRVLYRNLGPVIVVDPFTSAVTYDPRPTSTEVVGTTIYVTLAIKGGDPAVPADEVGSIDSAQTVALCLPLWMSNPDVSALVKTALVGTGASAPSVTSMITLSGGADSPLKDAEVLANVVARQFGHARYQDLMTSLDIPVVESDADAAKYLESTDDRYLIINKKLYLVEGTNLVGLRALYQTVQQDLTKLRKYLTAMQVNTLMPHVVYTESGEFSTTAMLCGKPTEFITLSTRFVAYDVSFTMAEQLSQGKSLTNLTTYVFWINDLQPSVQAYQKLAVWGFPDDYITSALTGDAVNQKDNLQVPPVVMVIEDPTLLDRLRLTDSEIQQLLDKDVAGIRAPNPLDQQDKARALDNLTKQDRPYLDSGLRTKLKRPVVALQAVDVSATMNDENLSKELSTRGKGCARTPDKQKVGNTSIPNLPKLDLPNLPTSSLPDPAKKVESAFAALSSLISTASKLFDRQVDGVVKTLKSVLNKVMNLMSLTDNLFNNDLIKCLLGTSEAATGAPDVPSPSTPGGVPSVPVGGLPLPLAGFKLVFKTLSVSLDKIITSAFETLMKLIQEPLCMIRTLLESIMGIDLKGVTNPCKSGKDPDAKCPKSEVQAIINQSTDMSKQFQQLPQLDSVQTSLSTTTVTDQVQKFSGLAFQTATTTVNAIQRGINDTVNDLITSLNSKTKVMDELFKTIKALIGESSELADQAEVSEQKQQGCGPPALGAFTDAVTKYI
jgi:hypothetical protein